jgi:hypothetical protein
MVLVSWVVVGRPLASRSPAPLPATLCKQCAHGIGDFISARVAAEVFGV